MIFTEMTPCITLDLGHENMDYATAEDRMYRRPGHVQLRRAAREMVRAMGS